MAVKAFNLSERSRTGVGFKPVSHPDNIVNTVEGVLFIIFELIVGK